MSLKALIVQLAIAAAFILIGRILRVYWSLPMLDRLKDQSERMSVTLNKLTKIPIVKWPWPPTAKNEPNGRTDDQALPFVDPLDARELLATPLDADVVHYMRQPPDDPLDAELAVEAHVAAGCEACALSHGGRICAHCLELRICKAKPLPGITEYEGEEVEIAFVNAICRACANSSHEGQLDLYEGRK